MNFMDLIESRRSVREYADRPVAREKIERCLEAARLAPSACNSQPCRFIVVDEPALRQAVARAALGPAGSFNRFAAAAPLLVAVTVERNIHTQIGGLLKGMRYNLIDLGIAAEHFCLQAVEEGLGTCMIGWFGGRRVKRLLGVPRGRKVGLLIAVGYPADGEIKPKKRKPLEEIRSYNRFAAKG